MREGERLILKFISRGKKKEKKEGKGQRIVLCSAVWKRDTVKKLFGYLGCSKINARQQKEGGGGAKIGLS